MNSQFELDISGLELSSELLKQAPEKTKTLLIQSSLYFLTNYFEKNFNDKHQFSCHLQIVSEEEIQRINKEYRNKNSITDVLSFPVMEDLRNNPDELKTFSAIELGDIFICWNVLLAQASEFGLDPWEELIHLYIHGFLHLAGFDHDLSESEQKLMEDWEQRIIAHSSSTLSS